MAAMVSYICEELSTTDSQCQCEQEQQHVDGFHFTAGAGGDTVSPAIS